MSSGKRKGQKRRHSPLKAAQRAQRGKLGKKGALPTPEASDRRIAEMLDLAYLRAKQNSSYTMEQAQTCAVVALAMIEAERLRMEKEHGSK
jgi:hypothetical protein